jgi:nucleoside phosphorylase
MLTAMFEPVLAVSETEIRRRIAHASPSMKAGPARPARLRRPEVEPRGADDPLPIEEAEGESGTGRLHPQWQRLGQHATALIPRRSDAMPPATEWRDTAALPAAQVVVLTWTVAEWDALDRVFVGALAPPEPGTNGKPRAIGWEKRRARWLPYRRDFSTIVGSLRLHSVAGGGTPPSLNAKKLAWGYVHVVEVGGVRVLLFKSELHLNRDGVALPLANLVERIIAEARPDLLLSTGTAGGLQRKDVLGDVVVSNKAQFWLEDEFASAAFNFVSPYESEWRPPDASKKAWITRARELLVPVKEMTLEAPTLHYGAGARIAPRVTKKPVIKISTLPVLSTDYFEYGTTKNGFEKKASCVEMDDAVVAMVAGRLGVPFGFVRNVSDSVLEGDLPGPLQLAWAVATYQKLGLQTSFNGAIGTWAVIADWVRTRSPR